MKKRLERAIEEFNRPLYSDYEYEYEIIPRKRMILVSGTKSESEFMESYLHNEKEIDMSFIIVENESRNTIDNIKNSQKIIEKNNLIPSQITICTSSFHIKRTIVIAGLFFHKYGCILRYIHTNEVVSDEEKNRETYLIVNLLDAYVSSIF
jgi:uncharacterized SAM-binding protein YcdF (DUF218 family)